MKLSVFAVCLADRSLKDALAYLKGKGVQKLGGRGKGDQIIHYTVSVPKNLSEQQKRIIRELDETIPQQNAKKGFFNSGKN